MDERLQKLESVVAPVWRQLTTEYVDLSVDIVRKVVALFVATLYLRHPSRLETARAVHQRLVHAFGQLPRDAAGRPRIATVEYRGRISKMDTSDWDDFVAQGEADIQRLFVSAIRDNTRDLAELLIARRWSVVVAESPTFATSDAPVMLLHPTRVRFGFRTAGTILQLPLSPTRLLIVDELPEPQNQYYALKLGTGPAFNLMTWTHADQLLITSRDPLKVLREAVEFGERIG